MKISFVSVEMVFLLFDSFLFALGLTVSNICLSLKSSTYVNCQSRIFSINSTNMFIAAIMNLLYDMLAIY